MNSNTKGNKLQIVYSFLIVFMLFLVDTSVFLTAKGSEVGFFTELGLKKSIVLVLENLLILVLLIRQKKLKEKCQNSFIIKAVNVITLLITPMLLFLLVQFIIETGRFSVLNSYWIKNLIIYYIAYLLLLMIIRNVAVTISLYSIIMVLLALVDYFVTMFRGNAFILMDVFSVGTAAEVSGNYTFKIPVKTGICLAALLIYLVYQLIFQSLEIGKRTVKGYIMRIGTFAVVLGVTLGNWSVIADEVVDQWDTVGEYKTRGYIYKLACESRYLEIEKPEGYSVDHVQEIVSAVDEKDTLDTIGIIPENIIVIMNESLADFEEFDNFKASEEILPGIHSLQENTKKGYLYVPAFGGGTSDTEYEVLTGNTN